MKSNYNLISLSCSIALHIAIIICIMIFMPKSITDLIPASSNYVLPMSVSLVEEPSPSVAPVPTTITPPVIKPITSNITMPTPAIKLPPAVAKPEKSDKPITPQPKPQTKLTKTTGHKTQQLLTTKVKSKAKKTKEVAKPVEITKQPIIDKSTKQVAHPNHQALKDSSAPPMVGDNNATQNHITNYANAVINLLRPYINIPAGINPKATAIVEVLLLPNMQIKSVSLIQSSDNNQYDNSIKQALWRVAKLPPLPAGENWADYSKLLLTFHP